MSAKTLTLSLASILGVLSPWCVASSGPPQSLVEQYLQKPREGYKIGLSDVRCANYMESNGVSGRVSCAGNVVLKEDLYQDARGTYQFDISSLAGHEYFLYQNKVRSGSPTVAQIANKKGVTTPFKAELYVRRVVDGWEFDGEPKSKSFVGRPLSTWPQDTLVVGSAEYKDLLNKVVAEKARFMGVKRHAMTALEQLFQTGQTFEHFGSNSKNKVKHLRDITIRLTSNPRWIEHPAKGSLDPVSADAYESALRAVFEVSGTVIYFKIKDDWRPGPSYGQPYDGYFRGTLEWHENPGHWRARVTAFSKGARGKMDQFGDIGGFGLIFDGQGYQYELWQDFDYWSWSGGGASAPSAGRSDAPREGASSNSETSRAAVPSGSGPDVPQGPQQEARLSSLMTELVRRPVTSPEVADIAYSAKRCGATFSYPAGWDLMPEEQGAVLATIVAPAGGDKPLEARTQIQVSCQPTVATLEELNFGTQGAVRRAYKDVTITGSTKTRLAGVDAYVFLVTGGELGRARKKAFTVAVLEGKALGVVLHATPETFENVWDEYQRVAASYEVEGAAVSRDAGASSSSDVKNVPKEVKRLETPDYTKCTAQQIRLGQCK